MSHLKRALWTISPKRLFGEDRKIRLRPKLLPFYRAEFQSMSAAEFVEELVAEAVVEVGG